MICVLTQVTQQSASRSRIKGIFILFWFVVFDLVRSSTKVCAADNRVHLCYVWRMLRRVTTEWVLLVPLTLLRYSPGQL